MSPTISTYVYTVAIEVLLGFISEMLYIEFQT